MTGNESTGPDRREALDHLAEPSDDGSRRGFLRGVAASAAAAVGLSGTAAALDPTGEVALDQLREQYAAPGAASAALRSHGGDLLAALANRGYLADGAPGEFDDVVGNSLLVGDTPTGHVMATTDVDGGTLTVVVEPENDRAYAVDDSGDRWTLLKQRDGGVETAEVTPDGSFCYSSSAVCFPCEMHDYACADGGCHIAPTGVCCSDCQSFCPC